MLHVLIIFIVSHNFPSFFNISFPCFFFIALLAFHHSILNLFHNVQYVHHFHIFLHHFLSFHYFSLGLSCMIVQHFSLCFMTFFIFIISHNFHVFTYNFS